MSTQLSPRSALSDVDSCASFNNTLGKNSISEQTHAIRVYQHSIRVQCVAPAQFPEKRIIRCRREITSFSDKSRRNLMRMLARVRWNSYQTAYFVTLTYHNTFPENPLLSKEHLHHFLIDLLRNFPNVKYMWKVELQRRGAPHYHLILLMPFCRNGWNIRLLSKDLYSMWEKHLDCGCTHCAVRSVDVQEVKSYRKCSYYLHKYISKETSFFSEVPLGRIWGLSRGICFDPLVRATSNFHQFLELRQIINKLLRLRSSYNETFADWHNKSWEFEVFLNDEEVEQVRLHLAALGVQFIDESGSSFAFL